MATSTRFVLLVAPPGGGTLMRARNLAAELPAPAGDDAVALAWMYLRMGRPPEAQWEAGGRPGIRVPFRAPHHTVSEAGLVGGGGGRSLYPGEASLAHAGCLVLCDVSEFRLSALRMLGHVVRAGESKLYRSGRVEVTYPARPALVVATSTPCPCGYAGDRSRRCTCAPERVARWIALLGKACDLVSCGAPWERETLAPVSLASLAGAR